MNVRKQSFLLPVQLLNIIQRWLKYCQWPSIIQTWLHCKEGTLHKHELCTAMSVTNLPMAILGN